jgi:outer membrane protein OmpA-like peptidoglycan-associated protein
MKPLRVGLLRPIVMAVSLARVAPFALGVTLLAGSIGSCETVRPAEAPGRGNTPTSSQLPETYADAEPERPTSSMSQTEDAGPDAADGDVGDAHAPSFPVRPLIWAGPERIYPTIHFAPGSTVIPKDNEPLLDAMATAILSKRVDGTVEVQGHADPSEGAAAKRLATERAERVRNALIARGVDPSRISAVGYGSRNPLVPPKPNGRKTNPRVTFNVLN